MPIKARFLNLFLAFCLVLGALALMPATPAYAATLTVTNTNDSGPGSLRQALLSANNGDVIDLTGISGTITLASTLAVNDNVVINGPGAANLTVSGNDSVRVFFIDPGRIVEINNLTISNGRVVDFHGAGISNSGVLTLDHVVVSNNNVVKDTVDFNRGGGIYSHDGSTLIITNSVISGNVATQNGGGIHVNFNATLSLDNVIIDSNSLTYGSASGGGITIRSGSTATLNNVVISNNSSPSSGGGLWTDTSLTMTNSLVVGNIGSYGGGLSFGSSTSTFNLTNVTISANAADNLANTAQGGGLYITQGTMNLNNVTVTGNYADSHGGGFSRGGVSTTNIGNSILGGNTNLTSSSPDCYGNINSLGYNLIQNTTGCIIGGTTTGNITGVDPQLGPLADYGGPTKTHALKPTSPAIDAGDNATGANTDQRGEARPFDGNNDLTATKDIGAYERTDIVSPTVTSIVRAGTNPTIATSVDFTVTFSESVLGVNPGDFSLAASGLPDAVVSEVSGSGTTYTVTVNNGVGAGTVGLNLVDDDSITDQGLNPLGGSGAGNGSFTGEVYDVDTVVPVVSSIALANPNPTALLSVDFTVTFSKSVSGVDDSDFSLVPSGITTAAITNVSGANDTYTVTVNTGVGNGSLGLNLVDDDSIVDTAGNKLGGTGVSNGSFTGDLYTVSKTAPAQITPANGVVLAHLRPFFDWSDFAGAKGYQIQVSKTVGFKTTIVNATVNGATNSQYAPIKDLPANTLLYWRVRAKLSATKYSSWSSAFSFTTGNPPSVPNLLAPANNALLTNLTPTLDWSDSTVPAGTTFDYYQLQLDDNSDFSSTVEDVQLFGVTSSSFIPGTLTPNTKYYWRVRSYNTAGEYSAWSLVRTFRESMLAPVLVSPIGGLTVPSTKPTFDWNDVLGATGYTIHVSLNNTFNLLSINVTFNTPTSTYVAGGNLQSGKTYFWRVRANGPNGPSAWSVVESFVTP